MLKGAASWREGFVLRGLGGGSKWGGEFGEHFTEGLLGWWALQNEWAHASRVAQRTRLADFEGTKVYSEFGKCCVVLARM